MHIQIRRPLMKDNLWWKTTFDGIQPLMEDNLWWNTPLMEDNLWWNTPLMEDNLWWKTTFDGRQPLPKLRYFTSSFLGVLIGWTKIVGYCQKQNFAGIFSNSIKGFENWRKSRPITYHLSSTYSINLISK